MGGISPRVLHSSIPLQTTGEEIRVSILSHDTIVKLSQLSLIR